MEFEVSTEVDARRLGSDSMQAFLNERAAAQTTEGQPCPKCGKLCRVRRKWVQRKVQSLCPVPPISPSFVAANATGGGAGTGGARVSHLTCG